LDRRHRESELLMPRRLHRAARDAQGFTLIETLVALVTGMIVIGATFAILEVSLHQSSRLTDIAEATQRGRATMTHVVDELHSACILPGFTPIFEKSNSTELIFVSAPSSEAVIGGSTAEEKGRGAAKHEIKWSEPNKTLTDFIRPGSGSWPAYTYGEPTPKNGVRIGENVSATSVVDPKTKAVTKAPIFTYYKYAVAASKGEASSTLEEENPLNGAVGLTSAEAATAASVLIRFTTAPSSAAPRPGRSAEEISQTTLAFTAPSTEAKISQGPCE
jgi:Tfp pilus assembly protein PilW